MKRASFLLVLALGGVLLPASTAECGVTVGIDVATLNRLLPSLAPAEVIVPLAEGNGMIVPFDTSVGQIDVEHGLLRLAVQRIATRMAVDTKDGPASSGVGLRGPEPTGRRRSPRNQGLPSPPQRLPRTTWTFSNP